MSVDFLVVSGFCFVFYYDEKGTPALEPLKQMEIRDRRF
jgi:hypothetical protein